MDSSEFTRRLGANPLGRDPELAAERAADPAREAEALAAEDFERRLRAALEVPVDEESLLAAIDAGAGDDRPAASRPGRRWDRLAVAASLVIVFGAVALLLRLDTTPPTVDEYLRAHYAHDGAAVLASAEQAPQPFDADLVRAVMSSVQAELAPELAQRVRFVKVCPTPHGEGAHMIVSTDHGPMTLIYMPRTRVAESTLLRVDGTQARVVAVGAGSAALIGDGAGAETELAALVQRSIRPAGARG